MLRAIRGFTLIETLVSIAIFVILVMVVSQTSFTIVRQARAYRENTTVSGLADQYIEIARNLPYSQIGTLSGNPHGNLPDQPNATNVTFNLNTYQIYYVVNYIDDPADGTILAGTDPTPNDYKQLKLYIKNTATGFTSTFLSNISPKGLENLSSGGALNIKVFDAVGQPIPNATINITNTSLTPNINLTRTSDANGNWTEVGLPDSANSYHLVVTKNGYSTDRTYAISGQNPNPTKPDGTISNGQVTQISFSIDQLSNLLFNTLDQTCSAISAVGLQVRGSKLIGTPSVVKFDNSYTSNGAGQVSLNNIEWDNYTPALSTISYMIYGSSPIQQISLLPNTTQQFTLILGPHTSNSLLVIVKDASTGNPIEGASVLLNKGNSPINTKLTGGSIWAQQDWSGGSGQTTFSDMTKYDQDDGNINTTDTPTALRLRHSGLSYASSGFLVSSTFDTGTASSSYTTLNWQPTSQDPTTLLKFQIATSNSTSTWNFLGPDGTVNTYYSVPGTTINSSNNGNRFVRYKVYLSTTNSSKTPVLTSLSLNYVPGCFTPGQVMFPGLQTGSDYGVGVSMSGFQTETINNLNINGYNVLNVLLGH